MTANWIVNSPYAAGALVLYEGKEYRAKIANPGYNPVISTYFWEPTQTNIPQVVVAAPAAHSGKKMTGCYHTGWQTLPKMSDVPASEFSLVYLFHAVFDGPNPDTDQNGDGSVKYGYDSNINSVEVQKCRARGQLVILTVGGARNGYNFQTRAQSTNFVESFKRVAASLGGVDGMDMNMFEAYVSNMPAAQKVNLPGELLWIAKTLKAHYGSHFKITAPPAGNVQDIEILRPAMDAGVMDWAGPQFYDWFGFKAPGYVANMIDKWVAAFGAERIMVGFSADYNFEHSLTLDECKREFSAVLAKHPNIKGYFCWSSQHNLAGGNVWAREMFKLLPAAPAPLPVTVPAPAPAPILTPPPASIVASVIPNCSLCGYAPWRTTRIYKAGDLVTYYKALYVATVNGVAGTRPTQTTHWTRQAS